MQPLIAAICTVIIGIIGGLLGGFLGIPDSGSIFAIATMGGFIISAISD